MYPSPSQRRRNGGGHLPISISRTGGLPDAHVRHSRGEKSMQPAGRRLLSAKSRATSSGELSVDESDQLVREPKRSVGLQPIRSNRADADHWIYLAFGAAVSVAFSVLGQMERLKRRVLDEARRRGTLERF